MAKNAGIRVISDSGILQVDSSYRNFHLIGKKDAPHYNDPSADSQNPIASGTNLYQPKSKTSILAYGMDSWYPDVDPRTDAEMPGRDYDGRYALAERISQPYFQCYGRYAYDASLELAGRGSFNSNLKGYKHVDTIRESSGPRNVYQTYDYTPSMPPKSANVNCSIYEFDLINLSDSASKSGMQVFDGEGKLVFDANYKPMRVVKFFESKVTYDDYNQYMFPANVWKLPEYNDGIKRKYAIAPLDSTFRFHNAYRDGYGGLDGYVTSGGFGSVDLFQFQKTRILHIPQGVKTLVKNAPDSWLYSAMQTVNYLLLDVTGY